MVKRNLKDESERESETETGSVEIMRSRLFARDARVWLFVESSLGRMLRPKESPRVNKMNNTLILEQTHFEWRV